MQGLWYVADLKRHCFEISERISRRRINSSHRARIHQAADTIVDIVNTADVRRMVVPAADEIPVTGCGHGARIMGVVDEKDPAACQFETCILSIVADNTTRSLRNAAHCVQIPRVIAMNYMDGQSEPLQHRECAGRHDITTVQDCLGT